MRKSQRLVRSGFLNKYYKLHARKKTRGGARVPAGEYAIAAYATSRFREGRFSCHV